MTLFKFNLRKNSLVKCNISAKSVSIYHDTGPYIWVFKSSLSGSFGELYEHQSSFGVLSFFAVIKNVELKPLIFESTKNHFFFSAPSVCEPNPCKNGGKCQIVGYNVHNCTCPAGIGGVNCTEGLYYVGF